MSNLLLGTKNCTLISGFSHIGLIEWFKTLPDKDLPQEIKKRTENGICYALVLDWLMDHDNAMTHQFYESTTNKLPKNKTPILNFFKQTIHKSYFIKMAHNFYNYTQLFTDKTPTFDIVYDGKTINVTDPLENFYLDNLEACNLYKSPNYFNRGAIINSPEDFYKFSHEIKAHCEAVIYANTFFKKESLSDKNKNKPVSVKHSFGFQKRNMNRSFFIEFFDPTFGVFNLGHDPNEIKIFLQNLLNYYYDSKKLEYVFSSLSIRQKL